MHKRAVIILMTVLASAALADAQTKSQVAAEEKAPWVVSVVHTVDLHKFITQISKQQDVRVGVPGSAPQKIVNVATGLVVDDSGHVVTRLAYLDPEDKSPQISVRTSTGATLPARVVGVDCATGFAILAVASLKVSLPAIATTASIANGTAVKIISADFVPKSGAQDKVSQRYVSPAIKVTQGRVSTESIYAPARGALTLYASRLLSRNDGSIVTTFENKVIGLAQYAGYGRAYLFPIELIRDTVAKRVIEKEGSVPAGWLGAKGHSISLLTETERGSLGLKNKSGVIIKQVLPNSPASTGGLLPNDVILGVDNIDIVSEVDLGALLSSMPSGRSIELRVLRNSEPVKLGVVLGAKAYTGPNLDLLGNQQQWGPDLSKRDELESRLNELAIQYWEVKDKAGASKERNEAMRELEIEIRQVQEAIRGIDSPTVASVDVPRITFPIGVIARPITPQLATNLGAKGGMLVASVKEGSPADRAGIKAGDIIVGTQGHLPMTPSQLKEVFATRHGLIPLNIVRDKQALVIKVNNP
ncbi:MAG TPA: PDZ domain-containing protein [Blastocatellia bacterium]|nr:PDZ domain-containing protein [Blastocatellia bacterium]